MAEVIHSSSPTLRRLGAELNDVGVKALLSAIVVNLTKSFNVGKTMNQSQVVETVELIIQEFPSLKIDEVKLCFKNAKAGHYGRLYDKIDVLDILSWLRSFNELKTHNLANGYYKQVLEHKEEERTPPSKEVLDMIKKTREELISMDRKSVSSEMPKQELRMDQLWIMNFDRIWAMQGYCRSGSLKYISFKNNNIDIEMYLDYKLNQFNRVKSYLNERSKRGIQNY